MYLRKKNSRCLALIFLTLYLTILVYASEIDLDYPSIINTEDFSINLTLKDFPDDNYDIKIDILGNGERVANIFDSGSGYKSTYYYIDKGIKNGEIGQSFIFKLTESYIGKINIDVKIRDSKDKTFSFKDYSSEINTITSNTIDKNEIKEENKVVTKEKSEENQTTGNQEEISVESVIEHTQDDQINEIIYLKSSPQDIKNQDDKSKIEVSKSKNEKIKEYSFYGFTLFLVFILIILILKKL